jgi:hypothetical protein
VKANAMSTEPEARFTFDRSFLEVYQGLTGAFGDPDGRRADLSDFVDILELRKSPLYNSESHRVRIVVGRKGSGKTFYLKHLKASLEREDNTQHVVSEEPGTPLIEESETTQLFGTRHVLRVSDWFQNSFLTEVWQQIWGRAIVLSVASHILNNKALSSHVSMRERLALRTDFLSIVGALSRDTRSPFTTARQLILGAKTGDQFIRTLDDPMWDDLESRVGSLLRSTPPIYVFIDAVDEDFTVAPMHWLRCQQGLFYETMRLMRHSRLGSQLHVIISVRDLVLYSVFRSEHASRYVGDPHVRVLGWGYESARSLLDAKIGQLEKDFWFGTRPKSLPQWIGLSRVGNRIGSFEDVYAYALRHTQCLPRDVVLFGNILGKALAEAARTGEAFDELAYQSVVSDLARISGLQQIEIVANQIRADEMPAHASDHDYVDSFLTVPEYADTRASEVIDIISRCKSLRISGLEFLEMQQRGQADLRAPDLGSVLWQAGLLGYVDREASPNPIFFAVDRMGRLSIPKSAEQYVFHPSMREVAGLLPLVGTGSSPTDYV